MLNGRVGERSDLVASEGRDGCVFLYISTHFLPLGVVLGIVLGVVLKHE